MALQPIYRRILGPSYLASPLLHRLATSSAENGLVAVTRDTTHFIDVGVPTLNPRTGADVDAAGVAAMDPHLDTRDLLARLKADKR